MGRDNERLECRIRDGHHPIGEVKVEISADGIREDDFEDVREAVKDVLDG